MIHSLKIYQIWSSRSGDYEDEGLKTVMPCSSVQIDRRVGRMYCFHLQGRREHCVPPVSCRFLAELTFRPWRWRRCSSEASVNFAWIIRLYNPEDCTVPINILCGGKTLVVHIVTTVLNNYLSTNLIHGGHTSHSSLADTPQSSRNILPNSIFSPSGKAAICIIRWSYV
jgi:hypothetical protein